MANVWKKSTKLKQILSYLENLSGKLVIRFWILMNLVMVTDLCYFRPIFTNLPKFVKDFQELPFCQKLAQFVKILKNLNFELIWEILPRLGNSDKLRFSILVNWEFLGIFFFEFYLVMANFQNVNLSKLSQIRKNVLNLPKLEE